MGRNNLGNSRWQAQRLANWNLTPYRIFLDASGVLRVEPYREQPERTWASVTVEVVQPESAQQLRKDPLLKERHGLK